MTKTIKQYKNRNEKKAVARLTNDIVKYLTKHVKTDSVNTSSNVSNSRYIEFIKDGKGFYELNFRISDHENWSCCTTPDYEISVATKHYHYQKDALVNGEYQFVPADFQFTYTEIEDPITEMFLGIEVETNQFDQLVKFVETAIKNFKS